LAYWWEWYSEQWTEIEEGAADWAEMIGAWPEEIAVEWLELSEEWTKRCVRWAKRSKGWAEIAIGAIAMEELAWMHSVVQVRDIAAAQAAWEKRAISWSKIASMRAGEAAEVAAKAKTVKYAELVQTWLKGMVEEAERAAEWTEAAVDMATARAEELASRLGLLRLK